MQNADLQVLPGPPHAFLKRRLLEELLRNPFLDESAPALALRLGASESDVYQALNGLLQGHFVRTARARGFMLDMELREYAGDENEEAIEACISLPEDKKNFSVLGGDFSVDTCSCIEEAIQGFPFGVMFFFGGGELAIANNLAANWLGVSMEKIDSTTFELVTGVDPMPVAFGASPLTFSVTRPKAIEISVNPCTISSNEGVVIVVRDVSLQEEISRMQGEVQEELFGIIKQEMVNPLQMIEQYLDHPTNEGIVQVRAAMEQINWFLHSYLLGDPNRGAANTVKDA